MDSDLHGIRGQLILWTLEREHFVMDLTAINSMLNIILGSCGGYNAEQSNNEATRLKGLLNTSFCGQEFSKVQVGRIRVGRSYMKSFCLVQKICTI